MTSNNINPATRPVAVIILNWNGEKLLRRYLPSVVANTPETLAEIVVADNGSTDGSLELLRKEFPTVRVMSFDKNLGFAGGYNRALELTESEFTVLLNSDVEVADDWLTPLYTFMKANPGAGACQPVVRSLVEPTKFEYAGAAGGFLDCNGFPYCRGRIFATTERDNSQYASRPTTDIFWASGAALMVRTDLYRKVGGLDTAFFAHMEEIDLCWRMQLAGYTIACVNSAAVYHLGGGSLPADNPRKTYLNFRNNLLMLHKNLPADERPRALVKRRLLDTIAWLRFVATLKFGFAAAILRAHRDYRRMAPAYASLPSPTHNLLKTRPEGRINILTQYFLHRRCRFSDLKFPD